MNLAKRTSDSQRDNAVLVLKGGYWLKLERGITPAKLKMRSPHKFRVIFNT